MRNTGANDPKGSTRHIHESKKLDGIDVKRLFSLRCRNALLSNETNYFSYLRRKILTASLYSAWTRFLAYFRRFRLISTVIKIISTAITVVGTGAFFIVIAFFTVVLIPFIVLFLTFFYLSGVINRKKYFKELSKFIEKRNIFVMFPSRGRPFESGSYFENTLNIISNDTNNFIILVSPYFISPRGIGNNAGTSYYHILRYESPNVCILRRSAFFALKKSILSRADGAVAYIY